MNILSLIAGLLLSLIRALLEIPVIWVGEIVLILISFGRHKPRWDTYTSSGGGDYVFLSELSMWIGVVAICGIGGAIKLTFFTSV